MKLNYLDMIKLWLYLGDKVLNVSNSPGRGSQQT